MKKEFRKWCKKYVGKGELKKYGFDAIFMDFLCCNGLLEEAFRKGIIK